MTSFVMQKGRVSGIALLLICISAMVTRGNASPVSEPNCPTCSEGERCKMVDGQPTCVQEDNETVDVDQEILASPEDAGAEVHDIMELEIDSSSINEEIPVASTRAVTDEVLTVLMETRNKDADGYSADFDVSAEPSETEGSSSGAEESSNK